MIAGLGNPGTQYEKTRHNLGFMLVDAFSSHLALNNSPGVWKERSGALVSEARIGSERIWLVKPQTFMNRSGEPLAQVMQFFKVEAAGLVVLHDEVDLPLGSLRIKNGGGDGGHNGIKSVVAGIGSADFVRFRLGIGRPMVAAENANPDVSNWVLGRFSRDEQPIVSELLTRSTLALEALMADGITSAQNRFNS
jgi:PTH1 family peptidyl-tRNA hydrolase